MIDSISSNGKLLVVTLSNLASTSKACLIISVEDKLNNPI
jgi:hypothetical protein